MIHFQTTRQSGFTLIELSIVLVIIGLIVGGVLVGQDLISAAETRAQVSQIEKTNTAVNTFRTKYAGIPGDLSNAATFGFVARTGTNQGDGDQQIESFEDALGACGETLLFWRDLGTAGLIEGSYTTSVAAGAGACNGGVAMVTSDHLPSGKMGGYLGVYNSASVNYYELAGVASDGIDEATGVVTTGALLKNQEAYNIDQKMDNGLPMSGTVVATVAGLYTDAATNGTCRASATAYEVDTAAHQSEVECNLQFRAQF